MSSKRGEIKVADHPQIEPARRCFACGPDNPIGLKIRFTLDGGACTGSFTPGVDHVGFDDTVHGGIVFTALDDVMANLLYLKGIKAFTARCEIRYRRALRVGQRIDLSSRIESAKKRLMVLRGEARLGADGTLVAECTARFMLAGGKEKPGP